jgi:hypothetical protein
MDGEGIQDLNDESWSMENLRVKVGTAFLFGDYNNDGKVDAADYVVWRRNTANSALPNDDGLTNQTARFNLWRANFGNIAGSGAAESSDAAVPEPSSLGYLLLGGAGVVVSFRRAKKSPARRWGDSPGRR